MDAPALDLTPKSSGRLMARPGSAARRPASGVFVP
jgi:hypothetical protein